MGGRDGCFHSLNTPEPLLFTPIVDFGSLLSPGTTGLYWWGSRVSIRNMPIIDSSLLQSHIVLRGP